MGKTEENCKITAKDIQKAVANCIKFHEEIRKIQMKRLSRKILIFEILRKISSPKLLIALIFILCLFIGKPIKDSVTIS